ncbi:MAG: MFS transporter [Pseudomonadota bacterium]
MNNAAKPSMFKAIQSVAALLFSFGLFIMANGLFSTLLGVRTTIEGFSSGLAGIIVACYFLGLFLGARYAVRFVGIAGYIRAFAGFASVMSISALLHVIWVDPFAWMIIRMLAGFCMAGLVMITESWLNQRADSSMRGQLLSFYMITNYLAGGCGQFLLPLADPSQFQLFSLVSIIFSMALIPILMTRATAPPPPTPGPVNLGALIRLSPVGVFGAFCAGWISATNNGLGPVLTREIGLSLGGTSLFMFCLIFSGLLLQWPIGRLSDRLDRRRVLLLVAIVTLIASAAMVFAIRSLDQLGVWPIFGLCVVYGSTFYTLYSISTSHIADNAAASGGSMVNVASGILVVYGSGAIIGPIVAGQVMTHVGPEGMFINIAVMLLLLCLYIIYRRTRRAAVSADEKQPFVPMPGTQFTGSGLYNAARREVDRAFSLLADGFGLRDTNGDRESQRDNEKGE